MGITKRDDDLPKNGESSPSLRFAAPMLSHRLVASFRSLTPATRTNHQPSTRTS